jgi:hypothetical protein
VAFFIIWVKRKAVALATPNQTPFKDCFPKDNQRIVPKTKTGKT